MKCEYCGLEINSKFPEKKIHKLCQILRDKISNGRNLTYANDDSYPMSYVTEEIKKKWPNLSPNSRDYVYTHEIVARLILNRDLVAQGEDDSEIVDHIHNNRSKKDFSPHNLRVMNLKDHVSSHKKDKGANREFKDGKTQHKYEEQD